jgi:hypothetical protein
MIDGVSTDKIDTRAGFGAGGWGTSVWKAKSRSSSLGGRVASNTRSGVSGADPACCRRMQSYIASSTRIL